tara:strand:+ start:224 stop:523 length:300 start_codon:yes stop_codon:yes gene_type:complete
MFNKVFKLLLSIGVFGFSIQQFMVDNIGNGIALIFLSLTFLLLYFKNEILIMAFLRMRKQDFEGTEKWLIKLKILKMHLLKNKLVIIIIYTALFILKQT